MLLGDTLLWFSHHCGSASAMTRKENPKIKIKNFKNFLFGEDNGTKSSMNLLATNNLNFLSAAFWLFKKTKPRIPVTIGIKSNNSGCPKKLKGS